VGFKLQANTDMRTSLASHLAVGALASLIGACSSGPAAPPSASSTPNAAPAAAPASPSPAAEDDQPLPTVRSPYDILPEAVRVKLDQPFTGDFDEMVKRRLIRAGVVVNRTQYFVDKGVQRGISYESARLFEEQLNKRLKTGLLTVHVAIVPLSRDQLFSALQAGKVDLVAAALTITPERRKMANFTTPTRTDVAEIPVTAADVAAPSTADDLSGREVFVRRSSSYYESLNRLNQSLRSRGKPPVTIKEVPEALEDDDILEMVNAGLVEMTIVDDFAAEFWQQVFPNIRLQPGAAIQTGGQIGIGVRKNNPKLLQAANTFVKEYGPRTAFGNTMERRYLQNADYVKNAATEAEQKKFMALGKFFATYSRQYDLDELMMAAQGYQESRLDQSAKSRVGAIGVMQVMPATGKELGVGDIRQIEPNIHAGVKYIRFMMDQYYKDDPMDPLNKALMTLASYNAGPGRIRQLRKEAAQRGLDPNVWFGNVERVASERIGRETVQYVSNIFKYYVAYRLVRERNEARARAKTAMQQH
jgi:membrane-bound lytic murein transglycosylase MltF